jgi:hypothetical protein
MRRFGLALLLAVVGCTTTSTTRLVFDPPPRVRATRAAAPAVLPYRQPAPPRPAPAPGGVSPRGSSGGRTGTGAAELLPDLSPRPGALTDDTLPGEPDLYCVLGPQMLADVDAMAAQGYVVTFELNGTPETIEERAGRLIRGCALQIEQLAFTADAAPDALQLETADRWRMGLLYMQWWLLNRRTPPPAERR